MRGFYARQKWVCSGICGAMRSMQTPPPPFFLKIYPCAYVLLFICLFVCTTFFCFCVCLSSCPASPSVHPSSRPSACPSLLDYLFVLPSLCLYFTTYDCPLSVHTWQSICLLIRVCFSKLIFYIFY